MLNRIEGVGDVLVLGAREYSMRVWLDPDRMWARQLTTNDVVSAIQAQNVQFLRRSRYSRNDFRGGFQPVDEAEQVRERLAELWSYLTANQTRLINYGREYREGHRISTARVESTVDQLVDWRMEKKQHMRWTKSGAQMLLHARCALLNGELGKYTGWSPSESSLEQAVAA